MERPNGFKTRTEWYKINLENLSGEFPVDAEGNGNACASGVGSNKQKAAQHRSP
jgi:hypothetical protein